ncbi:MAG: family ership [Candidatus Acidoferrum typicum]|nr:family ership [Candidatus Acidoferrum typicum]
MNAPIKQQRLAHRIFKGFALLTILGVLGVLALFVSLWLEHRTEVAMPRPTGPFAVGRALYDWVDHKTLDTLAPVPGTKRELGVWIWYPAAAGQSPAMDDYLPAPLRAEVERSRGALLSKFLTRDLSKVHGHSTRNSDVSAQQRSYPVVIMRAGASAEVWNYSTLAEDLASDGYVVVGFDAPYRTFTVVFPDGRVISRLPENNPEVCLERTGQEREQCANKLLSAWTGDIAFALDRLEQLNAADASGRFTGRLDMARVGVFGHSFGGAAALQFCHEDSRCKAGIDVDGAPHGSVIQAGVDRPFMILLSDHSHESDPEGGQIMANMQSIYDRLPANGRLFLEIRGANHFLFSEDAALLKSHIVMRTLRMLGILGIDGRRQLDVTTYCLRTFFDAYLKGEGVLPPKISSPLYPELQVLE